MRYSNAGRFHQQLGFLRRQFLQNADLPFTDVLSELIVSQALSAAGRLLAGRDLYAFSHALGLLGAGA